MEEWLLYSLLVLVLTSYMAMSIKYLGNLFDDINEIKTFVCLALIISGLISLFYLIFYCDNKTLNFKNIINKKSKILLLISLGVALFLSYLFQSKARTLCKIPGFPQLIINLNIILILFLSIFFFNKELNMKIILGIIITIIGLSIVILNNK